MRRAALAVVLVVLAGCSGLAGDGPTTPVEPAPVPVDPPPGVSEGGSVDSVLLLSSHVGLLRDGSATVTERRTERFANGSLRFDRTTTTYHGPVDRFYVVQTIEGTDPRAYGATEGRYERWANGTVGVSAVRNGDGVEYEPAYPGQFRINQFERLYPLFATLEPTVQERRRGGRTVFLARATRERLPGGFGEEPEGVSDLRNVSFRATIRPDGLVQSYRLSYTGTVDGDRVRVVEELRYRDVSATTVPRPEWVDAAIAELVETGRTGDADPG
jgi:hypothetical protein